MILVNKESPPLIVSQSELRGAFLAEIALIRFSKSEKHMMSSAKRSRIGSENHVLLSPAAAV